MQRYDLFLKPPNISLKSIHPTPFCHKPSQDSQFIIFPFSRFSFNNAKCNDKQEKIVGIKTCAILELNSKFAQKNLLTPCQSPKLYFNDPGLACFLLDIESPRQLARDKMRGAIIENYVVM